MVRGREVEGKLAQHYKTERRIILVLSLREAKFLARFIEQKAKFSVIFNKILDQLRFKIKNKEK